MEGALSLPFLVVAFSYFIACLCSLLVKGLFTSISTSNPDGGTTMFATKSIIFGADIVGVADVLGVGVMSVALPVQCGLRGGWACFPFVPSAYAEIIALKRFTSGAILPNISFFSMVASS